MPYWLISTYLVLTIAELFLSPMGLSFVSKVAPVRFQGLMQAGWLLATAAGNKLLFVGSTFWGKLPLWQLWLIFIVCCLVSAAFIFTIMKKLEKVTS
jgi:POT family proton-dependent oligopeptide transporter